MTSKRKEHCSRFPASILHPRVTPHVFHSWSLSRRLIHSKEQKWHGESGVIFFPLKNRKEKHLWARAQLLRRAKALCTFPSTLTVSLPVCGLDVGIRRGWSLVLLIQTGFLHVYGSGNEQKKSPIEERSYNKNLMVYWFRVNREFWAWK